MEQVIITTLFYLTFFKWDVEVLSIQLLTAQMAGLVSHQAERVLHRLVEWRHEAVFLTMTDLLAFLAYRNVDRLALAGFMARLVTLESFLRWTHFFWSMRGPAEFSQRDLAIIRAVPCHVPDLVTISAANALRIFMEVA